MATQTVGYAYLVDSAHLPVLPMQQVAVVDTATKHRRIVERGDQVFLQFEPKFQPAPTRRAHLQFALRYEGVDLQILSLLFAATGPAEVRDWLQEQPASRYARRAAFLYEWLTGEELDAAAAARSAFVPAVEATLQFDYPAGARNAKFRVIDNLPGTPAFCPLVRKTPYLLRMQERRLHERVAATLGRYPADLLRRASSYLYLKETHSSFEVERERPSPTRAQRFADLLREADTALPLTEARLVDLQNAVVDPRFREAGWRTTQNWIGDDFGYRKRVAFVPPRPADVPALMDGVIAFSARQHAAPAAMDAVVAAASIAFGFVFVHPFLDGNGRIHRYLIHESLATSGFTPPGIILPVSAVILADTKRYEEALARFSRPLLQRTEYAPETNTAMGNDAVYFRYFDATEQAQYLYAALERTIEQDLAAEIDYLIGFDAAQGSLNALADWPPHAADLFIRVVRGNDGRLSSTKRASHFAWMTDEEVRAAESAVTEAFARN